MTVSVTMPRLGESVSEGTVTRWLKREGEQVAADEPLLEVSTDKVDTEIPSPAAGVLKAIKVAEDETVEVGAELAVIEEGAGGQAPEGAGEGRPASADQGQLAADRTSRQPAQEQPRPRRGDAEPPDQPAVRQQDEQGERHRQDERHQQDQRHEQDQQHEQRGRPPQHQPPREQPAPAQRAPQVGSEAAEGTLQPPPDGEGGDGQPGYVTPLVRRLAAEHGVDLTEVQGTGVGGRIRKQDVIEAARSAEDRAAATQPDQPAAAGQPSTSREPTDRPADAARRGSSATGDRTEPLSRLRRVIAERMTDSLRTAAQLTTVVEADVTKVAQLRRRAADGFQAREGVKLSFLPFFAVATCDALREHPLLNASIDLASGTVTYHGAVHLGVAVDTERGLLVPVVHDADDLNLAGLARKIADLAARARSARVTPDELGGGTFTLTNTGSRGALFDTPIINQPQVGILGTGAVVRRPAVVDHPELGEVFAVRWLVNLALTYDHRLVDGADAARFLSSVQRRLSEGAFEAELGVS